MTEQASATHDGPSLDERYAEVTGRVRDAAARAGRRDATILVVAVTKYAEPDDIRRLMELGHQDFGENRVQQLVQRASMAQEWTDRARVLGHTRASQDAGHELRGRIDPEKPARWHMIGQLQRNKAKKVIDLVRLVHSVDSLRLAEELQQSLEREDRRLDVLLQVNCSGEESKGGCIMPAAKALAEQIDSIYCLRLRGLMTMAPYGEDSEAARPVFARCRELFEDIAELGLGDGAFNLLSMGMSGDYEIAIEEGANLVRVGSAIFGERETE